MHTFVGWYVCVYARFDFVFLCCSASLFCFAVLFLFSIRLLLSVLLLDYKRKLSVKICVAVALGFLVTHVNMFVFN